MKVLVAISDSFPYGAAYAARTRAICKMIQSAGYKTDVLCDYPSQNADILEYGRIVYVSDKPYFGVKKLLKLPNDYQKKLESLLERNDYDFVITRSMFDRFDRVLKTVRKFRIPIVLESCEWYDVKGFARGRYDIRYWQFQHCFKNSYNRVDGVIAISRSLEDYYKKKVKSVVRIPAIHEIDKLPSRVDTRDDDEIRFIFAGNIFGGKEQFEELIIALSKAKTNGKTIKLNIYGPTEEMLINSLQDNGKLAFKSIKDRISVYGMVPQTEVAKACMESDFGIFFRPDRRSSNAGFPTKLGEYLGAGTPVITNNTGDIALVLDNGINGYVIDELSITSLVNIIETCSNLESKQYKAMREHSRESANRTLDYRAYTDSFIQFADMIRKKG